MIKLYKDGITVEVEYPSDVARFKTAGYVEVKEPEPKADKPKVSAKPKADKPKEGDE